MTHHGWLAKRRTPENTHVAGVPLDPALATRFEEFGLLAYEAVTFGPHARHQTEDGIQFPCDCTTGRLALDAGSGITATQHIAPLILSKYGFTTLAVDRDPATLDLPKDDRVIRMVADITDLSHLGSATFDLVCCISTLEHMTQDAQKAFALAVARLTKARGTLVVTMDEMEPRYLAGLFDRWFDVGLERPIDGAHLDPRVSYLVARRHG